MHKCGITRQVFDWGSLFLWWWFKYHNVLYDDNNSDAKKNIKIGGRLEIYCSSGQNFILERDLFLEENAKKWGLWEFELCLWQVKLICCMRIYYYCLQMMWNNWAMVLVFLDTNLLWAKKGREYSSFKIKIIIWKYFQKIMFHPWQNKMCLSSSNSI